MKRLNLTPEPEWIEIDAELSVAVRPLSPFDLAELFEQHPEVRPLLDRGRREPEAAQSSAGHLPVGAVLSLVGGVAELAIADWTVIGDDGERLPVSAEAARALVRAEPELAGPLLERVLQPAIRRIEEAAAEKNGFAPSPAGTGAGAETIARPAKGPARNAPHG